VAIHAYGGGGKVRVITLGMAKFGLPDLVVEDVPSGFSQSAGRLLNVCAQTLAEGGTLGDNGTLRLAASALRNPAAKTGLSADADVTLQFVKAKADKGDPKNRIWRVHFPGAGPAHERMSAVFDKLFGVKRNISMVAGSDRLKAASKRALKSLMKHKARLAKGIPDGERLEVKAPFATSSGSNEYMWIGVTAWRGSKLVGILENHPRDVPKLSRGARVEVDESSVFDYILSRDGKSEGGETDRIIQGK